MKRQSARHACGRSLLLAVAVCTSAAGCGEGPWNDPYPSAERDDNVIYDTFSERPKHLDPISSYSENEAVFTGQIYEPPLQYHFLKRPYELEPLTATGLPEVTYVDAAGAPLPADAPVAAVARSVYRLRIRPGILYQPHPAFARDAGGRYVNLDPGGKALADARSLADFANTGTRELEAADYVYQVKRLAHPRVHSPLGGLMSAYIVGLGEYAERLAQTYGPDGPRAGEPWIDLRAEDFDGVRIVDRHTYEIAVNGKYPQFQYWLAMSFFAPMPWEADRFYAQPGLAERNVTLDWFPVGTGPYVLAENNPNRRMVLERNPHYRGDPYPAQGAAGNAEAGLLADAGRAMPFIDRAVFSLEKEFIPEWTKFLQGYYDTASISSDVFDQAVRLGAGGGLELTDDLKARDIRLLSAVAASTSYIGFNMRDPVVGGSGERARALRQAIAIAVDYEEFISIFLNGRGIPAQGPIPPGLYGYRDGRDGMNPQVYDWVDGRAVRKPLTEAKRLLAQAGYPDGRDRETGLPLVLNFEAVTAGIDSKSMFDWLRKQFARLDIQLVIRATDYNRFQEKMRKGSGQIFQWGWNADYPDPENFLFLLYGPNAKVAHDGENAANYANPEFDRLFGRMKVLDNGPERQAVIDEMVAIARRDSPWLWGFHSVGFTLFHGWYGNAAPNLMARNTLKYKRIDADARAERRAAWNPPVVWPFVLAAAVFVASLVPAWRAWRRRERAPAL